MTPNSDLSSMDKRLQDKFMDDLKLEVGSHRWQFPADQFARMVTPYSYTGVDGKPDLGDLDKLIKEAPLMEIKMGPEHKNYDPLVHFLNECVEKANQVIKDSGLEETSLFPNLTFFAWDHVMGDGVQRSARLKPDLIAVNSKEKPTECFWSPPEGRKNAPKLEFAVEVKDNWPELATQATTYAHAGFMASPLRSFCLVIGFNTNYKIKLNPSDSKKTQVGALRFMLCHHGGITASEDLDMSDTGNGRIQVVRILARLMLWETQMDAGIPAFTNGVAIRLPKSPSHPRDSVSLFIQRVLYHRHCVRGRNTFVARIGPVKPDTVDLRPQNQTEREDGKLLSFEIYSI